MALPVIRGCCKLPLPFSLSRLCLKEGKIVSRSGSLQSAAAVRAYSSERDREHHKPNVVFVSIPNPLFWIRNKIYYFLIQSYFDKDFSIEEFTEGAKQAFSHVSRLLAQCQFGALDGLVAKDLVGKLEEKCSLLPLSSKKALSADPEEIVYTTPADVGIYYGDNGRKFVSILMRFWYMTSAQIPDDTVEGAHTFKMSMTEEGEAATKRLLTANYEFQREFTKGVLPEWTITRIEHSKLLN